MLKKVTVYIFHFKKVIIFFNREIVRSFAFSLFEGDWLWLDNTIIDYTNWAENQPARGIYGELSCIDGTWKTSRAWERPYVCKTKKGKFRPFLKCHAFMKVMARTPGLGKF